MLQKLLALMVVLCGASSKAFGLCSELRIYTSTKIVWGHSSCHYVQWMGKTKEMYMRIFSILVSLSPATTPHKYIYFMQWQYQLPLPVLTHVVHSIRDVTILRSPRSRMSFLPNNRSYRKCWYSLQGCPVFTLNEQPFWFCSRFQYFFPYRETATMLD